MTNKHLSIFVYGTLKRGQVRERMWPRKPVRVEAATTAGALFDLGPYPALVQGSDVVEGELWHIAAGDMGETLRTLDEVEGYLPEGVNLYERRVVTCRSETGQMLQAWAYFYARVESLAGKTAVKPGGDGCCRWPERSHSDSRVEPNVEKVEREVGGDEHARDGEGARLGHGVVEIMHGGGDVTP